MKNKLIILHQLIFWRVERGCIGVSRPRQGDARGNGWKTNHSCCGSIKVPILLNYELLVERGNHIHIYLAARANHIDYFVYVAPSPEFNLCEFRADACRRDNLPATVPHWYDCSVYSQSELANDERRAKHEALSFSRMNVFIFYLENEVNKRILARTIKRLTDVVNNTAEVSATCIVAAGNQRSRHIICLNVMRRRIFLTKMYSQKTVNSINYIRLSVSVS